MTQEKVDRLVDELTTATLHGPVPLPTAMAVVEGYLALREELAQVKQCDKCDLCEDHHG